MQRSTPQDEDHPSAARARGICRDQIRDSGIGIPAHLLDKVFDLFIRVMALTALKAASASGSPWFAVSSPCTVDGSKRQARDLAGAANLAYGCQSWRK
jgi:hypothetical protein